MKAHSSSRSNRRAFITSLSKTAVAATILTSPITAFSTPPSPQKTWTVGEIIDLFLQEVEGAPFANTVDTLKWGSRDKEVKGIVTTMFANVPVIKKAISLGANFIIAHEPTFYNHLDKTDWLNEDPTYQYKAKLLEDNGITVWRNHDYIHSHKPDGVYSGVLAKLGWTNYSNETNKALVTIPSTTLGKLMNMLKEKLNISNLRFIGDKDQPCKTVLLMPGAAGGERQIKAIRQHQPDVAIVGELQEWETAEYIRDTRAAGKNTSLIVLGHTDSEDAGSIYMKEWLNKKVPEIKVTHIHSGNPFNFS